jgi:FkbM family methyltransferase
MRIKKAYSQLLVIKEVVKQLLPPIFWNIFRYIRLRLKKYHGQWKLDAKIEYYLDYNNGYYVELGALDGVGLSNTLYFEIFKKWQGILIEPAANNFLKCLNNRSNKNKFFCNACVSFEYDQKFVEMIYAHYMTTPLGLDSDIHSPETHALAGSKYLGSGTECIFKFGASAATLNEILTTSNAPLIIDLLSLDVEGAELEVLKGIDHKKYRFRLICVETRNIKRMAEYLNQQGYEYLEQVSPDDHFFAMSESNESVLKKFRKKIVNNIAFY